MLKSDCVCVCVCVCARVCVCMCACIPLLLALHNCSNSAVSPSVLFSLTPEHSYNRQWEKGRMRFRERSGLQRYWKKLTCMKTSPSSLCISLIFLFSLIPCSCNSNLYFLSAKHFVYQHLLSFLHFSLALIFFPPFFVVWLQKICCLKLHNLL